jgi:hypothetical protein
MSILTALSLVLFVGFVATGLVGFLGWRQRMRQGAGSIGNQLRRSQDRPPNSARKTKQYDLEGARL